MLADILPTGYEVGVLNGARPARRLGRRGRRRPDRAGRDHGRPAVQPEPRRRHRPRRQPARRGQAVRRRRRSINNGREDPLAVVRELTDGLGADVAIEAVGVPETFELCTALVRPGGRVANIGVHGRPPRCTSRTSGSGTSRSRPAWSTRTPRRPCCGSWRHQIDTARFITHHFLMDEFMRRMMFARAADTGGAEGRSHPLTGSSTVDS